MTFDPEYFQQQLATMASEAETKNGPIQMLNMIRFRDVAEYRNHETPDGPPLSGREAYATYSAHAGPFVEAVEGALTWVSSDSEVIILSLIHI